VFDYIPFPVFTHKTGMTHFEPTRYLKTTGAHTAERGRSGNSIDLYELQQMTLNNKNKNLVVKIEMVGW